MIFYSQDSRVLLDTEVDDSSYRYRAIMGDHNLTLYYSLAEHTEIPIGTIEPEEPEPEPETPEE